MPSTYTLNNGIELIGTGEQSGTWGDTTNTNLELLDTALDGQVSVTLAATGSSGSPNTLPISDGASSNGRNRLVIFGDGGDLGGTAFVQLTPNDAEKIIYVRNNLSGSRSILLFQGTYSASNDYEVPAGTTAVVFFNGAGTGAVAANVFNNAFFDSLRLGSVSVDKILDEDNMASNDAAALATQQSIKAYVDSQVGTVDTLAEILANGNTTGGNDILFADNDNAIFGAGSDLRIYHDASDSYIRDTGIGDLYLAGSNNIYLTDVSFNPIIRLEDTGTGGIVHLYNEASVKLTTTNTGVDINGTAVTDGVTVAGNLSVDGGTIKLDGDYPTGTSNVALGNTALDSVASDGNYNVAVGSGALTANTSGDNNVGLGRRALFNNTTASSSVALGTQALNSSTTGANNVSVGYQSSLSNVTGSGNTMAGYQAGYLVGDEIVATAIVSGVNYTIQTLGTTDFTLIGASSNTVGSTFTATGAGSGTGTASANAGFNTFIGYQSGDEMIGGSRNTILGSFNGNQNTVDIRNSNYNIVISDGNGNPRMFYNNSVPELVINEQSADVDFRVESNNNANALFVDAGRDRIYIGKNTSDNLNTNSVTIGGSLNTSWGASLGFENDATGGANGFIIATDDSWGIGSGFGMGFGAAGSDNFRLFMKSGETVFNERAQDIDFRVESDSNTHMLFVDAGDNEIRTTKGANTFTLNATALAFNRGVETGTIFNSGRHAYQFNADASTLALQVYNGAGAQVTNGAISVDTSGGVTFNEQGIDADFRVESNGNANMFTVNAGDNRVGVGTLNGLHTLSVFGTGTALGGQGHFSIGTGALAYQTTVFRLDANNNFAIDQNYASADRNRLFIERSTGFIGVGTESPDSMITIKNTGTNMRSLRVYSSGSAAVIDLGVGTGQTNGNDAYLAIRNQNAADVITLSTDGVTVFNDNGDATNDFRVESDNESNMFFLEAANDRIFIGGSASSYDANRLNIRGPSVVPGGTNGNVGIFSTDNMAADKGGSLTFGGRYSGGTYYMFGGIQAVKRNATSGDASGIMKLYYVNNSNATIPYHIASQDEIQFNPDGNDVDFSVASVNNANMFVVDAGSDKVQLGSQIFGAAPTVSRGEFVSFNTNMKTVSSGASVTNNLFTRSPDTNVAVAGTCYIAAENSGGSVQWGVIIDFFMSNGVLNTTTREAGSSQGTTTHSVQENGNAISVTVAYAGGIGGAIRFNASGHSSVASY